MPTGLGGEQLWLSATNDNTGTSTAFDDQSGQGNNGTATGTLVVADTSEGGTYAFDFDGVNDFIQLPAGVVSASDPITISLWVEHTTTGNTSRAYVSDWDYAATKRSFLFGSNAGNHLAYFSNTGSSVTQQITGSATSTTWTHVLISQSNAGDIEFYKDGVLDDTGGPYIGRYNSGSAWLVGAIGTPASPIWPFNGKMDDIRAYNRVLTQAEITHLSTSRGIQGAPQVLNYENTTNVSGVSIQSDVDVDGINLLQTDGDIQDIEIKIKWSNASSWQGCECYVIDPDGSYHYLFSAGSLPFGSGSRVDSMTISSGSFPLSMDGTWEFHLSDQMFNSNTIDEVSTDFEVIQTNMPDTYSEVSWYGGGFYRGGVDLSGNTNHVYPHNSASIVADTGSNGSNAFSFSSASSQRWSDGIIADYNNEPQWSVSAWVKPDQNTAFKQMIFCNHGYRRGNFQLYQAGDEFGLFLGYYDPAFSFGDAEIITTTNVNITTGSWYNIIATFDGGAATQTNIYVNGASAASSRQTVASGISVLPLNTFAGTAPDQTIGAMKDAAGSTIYYPFDGEIDACRTVNSVYTSGDITWLASGRNVAGGPTDFKSYYKTNQSSITGFPNA